jgi:hypothetical protein
VDDVDALHGELVKSGGKIVSAPKDEPHGCREMLVEDGNGLFICFGQEQD